MFLDGSEGAKRDKAESAGCGAGGWSWSVLELRRARQSRKERDFPRHIKVTGAVAVAQGDPLRSNDHEYCKNVVLLQARRDTRYRFSSFVSVQVPKSLLSLHSFIHRDPLKSRSVFKPLTVHLLECFRLRYVCE